VLIALGCSTSPLFAAPLTFPGTLEFFCILEHVAGYRTLDFELVTMVVVTAVVNTVAIIVTIAVAVTVKVFLP
jgi:hypothetical protein